MTTSNAAQIVAAIKQKHQYNGQYYPPQSDDIIEHLKSNNIDYSHPGPHQHNGFDESYDKSLVIFHYADKSVLIVGPSGISAPY